MSGICVLSVGICCCFFFINAVERSWDIWLLFLSSSSIPICMYRDNVSITICAVENLLALASIWLWKLASRVCLCCGTSDYNHTRQVPVVLYADKCFYFRGQSSVAEAPQSIRCCYRSCTVNTAGRPIIRIIHENQSSHCECEHSGAFQCCLIFIFIYFGAQQCSHLVRNMELGNELLMQSMHH